MVLIDVSEQVTNTALQGTHWPFQRAEAGIPYTSWPS